MYFISQKPKNLWLIGIQDHNIYGIGDRNDQLVIYQKDCFDAGEWDEIAELNVTIQAHEKCEICQQKMPVAAGIIQAKLWVMASGTLCGENSTKSEPHVFCVDLETKEITTFKTEKSEINEHIKLICMKCDTLQITFEDIRDGKPRFMVQPNRLRSAARFLNFSNPFPRFKQFYFAINDESQTCNFGYFDNLFETSKGVFVAGINENVFAFGLQRLMYLGFKQVPAGGDYRGYTITNFAKTEEMVGLEFYCDSQNELHYIIKEKIDDDRFKLSILKPNINMENETVSIDFVSSFIVADDFPDIQKNLIFTTPNLIVFSSGDTIVTVINRVFTLSESAYLALKNVSTTEKNVDAKKLDSSNVCISMKYLREKCGIAKNVSINHGNS